ncbi:MAG: GNAT family protein [Chloroflexota bacterium]
MNSELLLEFPFEFESERLLIRGPLPGDGKVVRPAVLESVDELRPWMPWAMNIPDEDGYEALVRQWHLDFMARKNLILFLFHKETGQFIGGSGLHDINWTVPRFEIGYWVRSTMARQGYIMESTQAITNFAFDVLKAERMQIRVDSENYKSAAIPPKLGYTLEGTHLAIKRHHITNELRDMLVFAKLRS